MTWIPHYDSHEQYLYIFNISNIQTNEALFLNDIYECSCSIHQNYLILCKNFIFIIKIWSNDIKVGCKASFDFVELINSEIDLEEKLNEFKNSFERKELYED